MPVSKTTTTDTYSVDEIRTIIRDHLNLPDDAIVQFWLSDINENSFGFPRYDVTRVIISYDKPNSKGPRVRREGT